MIVLLVESTLEYLYTRDVEAEAGNGTDPFSVEAEAEARKIHHFRFLIGGKN